MYRPYGQKTVMVVSGEHSLKNQFVDLGSEEGEIASRWKHREQENPTVLKSRKKMKPKKGTTYSNRNLLRVTSVLYARTL